VDQARLLDKLRKVEALFAGATTEGERSAADHARDHILRRLKGLEEVDPPIEYRFTMRDEWARALFVALLRRYGLPVYRYRRQRYTTVMTRVPTRFVDEVLWPEFDQLDDELHDYLREVTQRIVSKALGADTSDAEVIDEPRRLT
jgi:hypothetical protein